MGNFDALEEDIEKFNKLDAEYAVKRLNHLLKLDPVAMRALVEARVPVNAAMLENPRVQCMPVEGSPTGYGVGLLGIVNAVLEPGLDGRGRVTANFTDDESELLSFSLTHQSPRS